MSQRWAGGSLETLEDMRRFVLNGVELIGTGFETPDDDWVAVMFIQHADGVEAMSLDGWLFRDGPSKDVLGEVLRRHVAELGAFRYALLLNTHQKLNMPPEEAEEVLREQRRISELPGAIEMLMLLVGDAEEEQVWWAEIKRTPANLRTPGRWERLDPKQGWEFQGRFRGLNAYLR